MANVINVPGNIYISKNARGHIKTIEKNNNYNTIVLKINEMLEKIIRKDKNKAIINLLLFLIFF